MCVAGKAHVEMQPVQCRPHTDPLSLDINSHSAVVQMTAGLAPLLLHFATHADACWMLPVHD
jgi:hypothetical protein